MVYLWPCSVLSWSFWGHSVHIFQNCLTRKSLVIERNQMERGALVILRGTSNTCGVHLTLFVGVKGILGHSVHFSQMACNTKAAGRRVKGFEIWEP